VARPASVALAGFYPTPAHLLPRIARLFSTTTDAGEISLLDPCAGEGRVLIELSKEFKSKRGMDLYACELEATRYQALEKAGREIGWWKHHLHGDAFRVTYKRGNNDGVSLLFLNPPYDNDSVHGRLEHKFLSRFVDVLMDGGILVYVVPFYSLKVSAEFLASRFSELHCYRFPDPDFDVFKQVVLVGKRSSTLFGESDPRLLEDALRWASDPERLQTLPRLPEPLWELPRAAAYKSGLEEWTMRPVDLTSLLKKVRPWMQSTKSGTMSPIPEVLPELPVQSMLLRKYPVATPPRPAHIAAGIASGLFNGARLRPAYRDRNRLPSLLVKGVFDKEYKTVEEKKNKNGETTGLVQVQQPKLVTTVLDLSTFRYHTLKSGVEASKGIPTVESMSIADLIEHYGDSMTAVMAENCPVLYDPRRDAESVEIPSTPRSLFTAQAHATRALVKLLGGPNATKRQRKGKACILLGEIGSGKSTVALMVGETLAAKRILIMCPPHLLTSWSNEIAAVLPQAEVVTLSNVEDVDRLASRKQRKGTTKRTIIALLSREAAKLSHSWEGVEFVCPKCGKVPPGSAEELAKKRARCSAVFESPVNEMGRISLRLGYQLFPHSGDVASFFSGRHDTRRQSLAREKERPLFRPLPIGSLDDALVELLLAHSTTFDNDTKRRIEDAIVVVLHAAGDDERILKAAACISASSVGYYSSFDSDLMLMLPPGDARQKEFVEYRRKAEKNTYGFSAWQGFEQKVEDAKKGKAWVASIDFSWEDGEPTLHKTKCKRYTLEADRAAFFAIRGLSLFETSAPCGEFLYQAVPEPRRIALSPYIARFYPDLFDFFIADETHEYASDSSAQSFAAHRIVSLGIPTLAMTGTIMNGYAESLFTNLWSFSPKFRAEFNRTERQRFVDRYGYRKRIVEDRDKESKSVVEFGSQSDRVIRSERLIGNAPGLLPLFLLRHLLPISVTLHKADLAIDLPLCRQERSFVQPGKTQRRYYDQLREALVSQIKADRFDPELAGKLWGQLAELPSYLDRATEGYEIRYPESVGGRLVASVPPLEVNVLPKEQWVLEKVQEELDAGRNTMVFSWHLSLLPRLQRLLSEHVGENVPILYADKVPTAKRQDWIEREVVRKRVRVLIANPVAIQTGLNNLVHFASEIWHENPACNPVTYRQAIGRVDRIGQKKETRIFFPLYEDTLQVTLYDLLMKKVAVSVSTDGLDPESALQAAGAGEDEYMMGLSIGRQLWKMMNLNEDEAA
jgi:hypothetical protein